MSTPKKPVIVCVDDESSVLDSLTMQIRSMFKGEYIVETALSGHEGLQLIAELKEEEQDVALVISDYAMPKMHGDEFLSYISELDPEIHKVMLTGQATIEGITNAINRADLYRYIAKPWEETDLRLTITEALKSWMQNRELRELLVEYESMYSEAQRNYQRAQENFIASIKSLANAIDARDPYTNGHSQRVTQYAMLIGERIGIDKERLEYLEYMAILHDIGKIGIPDGILHKAAELDEQEFEHMKQHVSIGASIIEDMEALKPLISGILYHHEHFDGQGYIFHKSSQEIPLEARIISVADAYDAMTSDRPYRKGLSHLEAVEEFERCRGTQFDPEIVDVFLKILSELRTSQAAEAKVKETGRIG